MNFLVIYHLLSTMHQRLHGTQYKNTIHQLLFDILLNINDAAMFMNKHSKHKIVPGSSTDIDYGNFVLDLQMILKAVSSIISFTIKGSSAQNS